MPEGLRVFAGWPLSLRQQLLHRRVEHLPLRDRDRESSTAVSNAALGFFRPLPLDDSQLIVLRYAAKGFVPTLIEAQPTEDLSAVTFLGEQVAEKYPEVQSWVAPAPSTRPLRIADPASGSLSARARAVARVADPGRRGLPELRRPRRERPLQRSARASTGSTWIRATARTSAGLQSSGCTSWLTLTPETGRPVPRGIAPTSTTSLVRPSAASQATTATSATTAR